MGLGCRLFKLCRNLPPGHYGAGVQAALAVSDPTLQVLSGRDAGCLSSVGIYLLGSVGQGAGCLSGVGTYLQGSLGHSAGCLSGV